MNLMWRSLVWLVPPVIVAAALLVLSPSSKVLVDGLLVCLIWTLGSGIYLITVICKQVATLTDNTCRIGNGLPVLALPDRTQEFVYLNEALLKLSSLLETSNHNHQALLANSADVIATVRPDLVIASVNRAVTRFWGYEPFFMTGRSIADFVCGEDNNLVQSAFEKARGGETPVTVEVRINRRDGAIAWSFWSCSWSKREETFYCVVRDITQQKAIEVLKRDFFNMVSHDMRSPLLSLQAVIDILLAGAYGELNQKGRGSVDSARASIQQLLRLVNDLLDVQKMEEGKLELECCPLFISEIVMDAIKSLEHYAAGCGVKLVVGEIPDVGVTCDPRRILQVLQNLLSNAVKFSAAGTEVVVSVEVLEEQVEIRVVDHGRGIPEEHMETIFDRFRQLPGSAGVGLGLTICKKIIELHDGSIGVNANPSGKGSTFWFRLPAVAVPVENSAS